MLSLITKVLLSVNTKSEFCLSLYVHVWENLESLFTSINVSFPVESTKYQFISYMYLPDTFTSPGDSKFGYSFGSNKSGLYLSLLEPLYTFVAII